MNKCALVRSLLLLAALSVFALGATAQEMPPKLAEVWVLEIKPGQGEAFRAAVKAHVELRQEQGDPRSWQAYVPVLGDALNRFVVRQCCFEWADVDAHRQWDSEHPAVGAHYVEHLAPHVDSVAHHFETVDWANSRWNEAGGPYHLFAVTEFRVDPANSRAFDEARVKMSQIAIQAGWAAGGRSWLWLSSIGGSPTQAIVIPHRDFASLEGAQPGFADFLAEQLGSPEKAAELLQSFMGAVGEIDYQIWEHEPDLSMPETE
jgi:hypothetical protein